MNASVTGADVAWVTSSTGKTRLVSRSGGVGDPLTFQLDVPPLKRTGNKAIHYKITLLTWNRDTTRYELVGGCALAVGVPGDDVPVAGREFRAPVTWNFLVDKPGDPKTVVAAPTTLSMKPTTLSGKPTGSFAKPTALPGNPTILPGKPTILPGKPTGSSANPTALPVKPTILPGKPKGLALSAEATRSRVPGSVTVQSATGSGSDRGSSADSETGPPTATFVPALLTKHDDSEQWLVGKATPAAAQIRVTTENLWIYGVGDVSGFYADIATDLCTAIEKRVLRNFTSLENVDDQRGFVRISELCPGEPWCPMPGLCVEECAPSVPRPGFWPNVVRLGSMLTGLDTKRLLDLARRTKQSDTANIRQDAIRNTVRPASYQDTIQNTQRSVQNTLSPALTSAEIRDLIATKKTSGTFVPVATPLSPGVSSVPESELTESVLHCLQSDNRTDSENLLLRVFDALATVCLGVVGAHYGYNDEKVDDTSVPWMKLGSNSDCEDFAIAAVSFYWTLLETDLRSGDPVADALLAFLRVAYCGAWLATGYVDLEIARPDIRLSEEHLDGHAWCVLQGRSGIVLPGAGGKPSPANAVVECTSPYVRHGLPPGSDDVQAYIVASAELYDNILCLDYDKNISEIPTAFGPARFMCAGPDNVPLKYRTIATLSNHNVSYAVGSGSGHGLESPETSSDRFRVGATLSDFVTGNYSVTPVADAESTRLYNLYFRGFQLAPDFSDPEIAAVVRSLPGKTRYLSRGDVQTTAEPPVSCVAVITAANYHRVLGGTIGGIPDTDTIGLATVSFLCDDLICVGRTVRRTVSKTQSTSVRVHV